VGTQFDILNASSIAGSFSSIDVTNSTDTFKAVQVGDEIELTVESTGAAANASTAQVMHAGMLSGHYGHGVAGGRRQFGPIVAPVVTRILTPAPVWSPVVTMTNTLAKLPATSAGGAGVPAPVWSPVTGVNRGGITGFRPRDEFGSSGATLAPSGAGDAGVPGSMGIAGVSAAAYNGMAAMNHMRFECGVDLKALLKTSRKQLLKGLWAAPDSPDAINIGYMSLTTR
jgi:hypothetical protein